MATRYRHPSRETGVSCSSCGRPICPDCMTPTPVGMRCPDCARDRTKVRTARAVRAGGSTDPMATYVLIALNVIAFVAEQASGAGFNSAGGGTIIEKGGLAGTFIDSSHQYYRLITSGFLHA